MEIKHSHALKELKALFARGGNSLDWDLSQTIKRAEQDAHPNMPLLRAIADVITQGSTAKTLDIFAEWRHVTDGYSNTT